MTWLELHSNPETHLHSGSTLMLPAIIQHEESIVIMICDGLPSDRKHYAAIALTGAEAGVNFFAKIPHHIRDDGELLAGKIYDNCQAWFHISNPSLVSFACTEYPDGIVTWLNVKDINKRTKGWLRLEASKNGTLARGALIKFPASYPFEEEVVMMVCETSNTHSSLGLITITGYKAGINPYVAFPDLAQNVDDTVGAQWLYDNWQHWVWPEGSPDDVWILPEGLSANDLK
jgi:hypothetical protein